MFEEDIYSNDNNDKCYKKFSNKNSLHTHTYTHEVNLNYSRTYYFYEQDDNNNNISWHGSCCIEKKMQF